MFFLLTTSKLHYILRLMEAPIVTLTTDWGQRDFYAGRVKGKLYSLIPDVKVVDISHEQVWNDLVTLMRVIRYGCMEFPEGTIHIVDVGCDPIRNDMQAGQEHYRPKPVLLKYRGHYFICSELRPLQWALESEPEVAVQLMLPRDIASYTFLAYELYCLVAQCIVEGADIRTMGNPCEGFRLMRSPSQPHDADTLNASVTNIDSYGNAILNVTYAEFETVRAGRRFRASLDSRSDSSALRSLSTHYNDVRMGGLLLTVSTTGHLQIAVNGGSAEQLIGLRPTSHCYFTFYE